jgi:hypothetical protein
LFPMEEYILVLNLIWLRSSSNRKTTGDRLK